MIARWLKIIPMIVFVILCSACGPTAIETLAPTEMLQPEIAVASLTPQPSSTSTPQPTATPLPEPTATPLPEPTATLAPGQTVLDGHSYELLLDTWQGLILFDVDTRQSTRITTQENSRYPLNWEWSPDGSVLLYQLLNPDNNPTINTLYLFNPETGEQNPLLNTDFQYFHWHPNSRAILLGNTFIDAANGEVLADFAPEAAEWMRAAISPDGRQLILTDMYGTQLSGAEILLDASGQVSEIGPLIPVDASVISALDGRAVMDIQWNPQGGSVALEMITWDYLEGDVYLLNLEDSSVQKLTANMDTAIGKSMLASPLSWSADGTRIAFTRYEDAGGGSFTNPRVFIADVETGTIVEITGGPFPNGKNAFWVPDMQGLVFFDHFRNVLVTCRPDGSDMLWLGSEVQAYFGTFRP
jgi:Tol biopolymer transport system component